MSVFLLALFGMICWGIAPIFAKVGLKNMNPSVGLVFRTLFAASVVTCWAVANGTFSQMKGIPVYTLLLIAIESLLATLVGDLAYFAAIKRGDVSLVTIIMSSSPFVTLLFACIFLGEKITLVRFIGAAFVITGIILII
ncbi:MAG TPA: EamA family transporter [Clostridiales bacterium]|nr:EamA family transporter [Clostridiales bacterium]